MVNFNRLKKLIREYEDLPSNNQVDFFKRLHSVSEVELSLRQSGLGEF